LQINDTSIYSHFSLLLELLALLDQTWGVSNLAKQAAQVVKHHVFDERTVIT
jgi:hypothetical protein